MSPRTIRTRARRDDERGATLILAALSMIAIVIIAAIVIDLGHERMMRRTAQSVSDMAALAGSQALMQPEGAAPVEACEEALQYLRLNIEKLPATATLPCEDLDDGLLENAEGAIQCDADISRRTVTDGGTAAPYHLEVSWPIPNADIEDDLITDPEGLRGFDGHEPDDQCDRFAVDVQIEQSRFFSKFLASGDLSGSAEAVARRLPYSDSRIPNLWLLEPYECGVLNVNGGSELVVGDQVVAGLITADSDGSDCQSNQYVIDAAGAGSTIDAIPNEDLSYPNPNGLDPAGEIKLYAMLSGQPGCVSSSTLGNRNACDPSDIANNAIQPEPVSRATRATRAPVDWTYNCKDDYPDYQGVNIQDCAATGERAPYIDLLTAWVTSNVLPGSPPANWDVYGDVPAENCNMSGLWESAPGKHVYVKCADLKIGNGDTFAATGGNVVFAGGVAMTGGRVVINDTSAGTGSTAASSLPAAECATGSGFLQSCFSKASKDAVWVYQRKDSWTMTGGSVVLNNAALVQQKPTTVSGENDFDAGSAGINVKWHAPVEGPLLGLALWSEDESTSYRIGSSGATVDLAGVFFAPEAYPFTLAGGSSLLPQAAQFVSRSLVVTGNGTLILKPLGIPMVEIPPSASVLIR